MTAESKATRQSYDAVAGRYTDEIAHELVDKPLDRALLAYCAEQAGSGLVGDLGSGPGHVGSYLVSLGSRVVALDLSGEMCSMARTHFSLPAVCADMSRLPLASSSLAAIVCWYSLIHLDVVGRATAYEEMARVLSPSGTAVVAFHCRDADVGPGGEKHQSEWWGERTDLTFRFLDPEEEMASAQKAGLALSARLDRSPVASEHQSERSYLVLTRDVGSAGSPPRSAAALPDSDASLSVAGHGPRE